MRSVHREIIVLVSGLLSMLLLGSFFGLAMYFLIFSMLVYMLWNLYNLSRLVKWLNNSSKVPPESLGVWDDVFFKLYNKNIRHKKSRKKLTKLLKRFQKSTKALPYATIILNSKNEIEWFNPASISLFGFRQGSDVGQRIDNLIRRPEFIKYLNNRNFDDPLEFENQHKKLLLNITSYGKGQNLLSATDITLQSKLNEMRRNFISNASHELRTPITVMSGYIEALKNNETDINKYPIDKIQQQTVRMEKIISELIELAKLEASKSVTVDEPIDTIKLLNEVYNEAVSLDGKSHNIKLNVNEIKIRGSYEEIRVAISNLLTNAIRYTPAGGEIVLSSSVDGSRGCVCVEDNGIGIAYEHISRLTERFYRVDEGRSREKGGTGLGLAIVKQILDRHNSILQITSELGKGSKFCCYFTIL